MYISHYINPASSKLLTFLFHLVLAISFYSSNIFIKPLIKEIFVEETEERLHLEKQVIQAVSFDMVLFNMVHITYSDIFPILFLFFAYLPTCNQQRTPIQKRLVKRMFTYLIWKGRNTAVKLCSDFQVCKL